MNILHRPRDINKRFYIKERRYGNTINYNFCNRGRWYPAGWVLNQRTLGNIHSKLHYLARHAPRPIRDKWDKIYKIFHKKHFGDHKRASVRFLNKYTCYNWL